MICRLLPQSCCSPRPTPLSHNSLRNANPFSSKNVPLGIGASGPCLMIELPFFDHFCLILKHRPSHPSHKHSYSLCPRPLNPPRIQTSSIPLKPSCRRNRACS